MPRPLQLAFLCLLLLALPACHGAIPPETLIRTSAKDATALALLAADAKPVAARDLRSIATFVVAITAGTDADGDGEPDAVDWDAVEHQVLTQLAEHFGGEDEAVIYLALAGDIGTLIRHAVAANPTPSAVQVFVGAGALGVVDGVDLYLLVKEPPP